jgi:hypothetical protein
MVARAPNLGELGAAFNHSERMPSNRPHESRAGSRFRTTLIRVLVVQAVALALLGLLQLVYNV